MKKIVVIMTLILALACQAIVAYASVCPNSPTGVHEFNTCSRKGGTHTTEGKHMYLYGHDKNGNPIYEICNTVNTFAYCRYKCAYCGTLNFSEPMHDHFVSTTHSRQH